MAYSYETELNNLKEAQMNAQKASLENTKNQTLSDIASEQQKSDSSYNSQRNTANVQNRLNAKNFQEYLASTGRANSGIAAQANLQNRNNLNTSLNNINSSQVAANQDMQRRITNANNTYNSGLTSAQAEVEANYINNLLDQRYKQQQMEQQQREFDESVRQFNEQMALQRQQLYSNFSSGSSKSGTVSGDSELEDAATNPLSTAATETNTKASKTSNAKGSYTAKEASKAGVKTTKKSVIIDTGKSSIKSNLYKINGNLYYKSGNKYVLYNG